MTEIQSYAIKNIRVVSTLMIFLCHTVFLFGETVGLTAQFFNIAVTVFFFISAYLYSLRENVSAGGGYFSGIKSDFLELQFLTTFI